MQHHSNCLQVICRLCGEERAIEEGYRRPIPKQTLALSIEAAFGFNVGDDLEDVHPPFVCKLCEGKLKRWWVKVKRKKMKASCYIDLAKFEGTSCGKCKGTAEGDTPLLRGSLVKAYEDEAASHGLITWQGSRCLQVMKMSDVTCRPVIFFTIFHDKTWELVVHGIQVKRECQVWSKFPERLSQSDVASIMHKISNMHVCEGNTDFLDLVEAEKGQKGQVPVRITPHDLYIEGIIRHTKCELLIEEDGRCRVCQVHRSDLMAKMSKQRLKGYPTISSSSSIPNKSLSVKQLQEKVNLLQTERRALKRRAVVLEEQISNMLRTECVSVDDSQDEVLRAMMTKSNTEMQDILGKDTPARLLWDQQTESALKGKQMRWHPAIIRWCIALQSKSSAAYNLLRQSNFLRLPHPSTLHPYTHFADPSTGFSAAMLERVVKDANINSCPEHERNVSLLFDEMKIKAGLGFSVRSGKVIGFTDVGSIGNEVANFERRCRGEKQPPASHVLVLMVRGIFTNLHAAVAYYPSTGATSDQLCAVLWEAVFFLEVAGFKVQALVSDGASSNRKFYRVHSEDALEVADIPTYCCTNPYDPTQSRRIYFICDVPHLIKTTRNNLENSGYHNKTKTMLFNKQAISWVQLLQLYERDVGIDRQSPGLRRLHKLSHEHLHLTPALRMRVYLAAQILSSTVANALESQKKPGTDSLVKFIRLFDTFFDCLNVSNIYKGTRLRKPALEPYRSTDDWRFEWLMNEFLGFLKEWDDELQSQDLEKATKKKMSLSRETIEGLKITVHSFVALAKMLLQLPGVTYLLSEKFNQDPLEEYFSKQRGAGGCNDNPTVEQFGHNMLTFQVASGCVKSSKRGNCRLDRREDEGSLLDDTPLPRRK